MSGTKELLYRTYVAHGQNSGAEYATSFSNEQNSFKSSLGFYVTSRTYYGRNGLSLKIEGLDTGYNDLASKRNIVLHGSVYAGPKFLQRFGSLGTSLGCPALPSTMSPQIIPGQFATGVVFSSITLLRNTWKDPRYSMANEASEDAGNEL